MGSKVGLGGARCLNNGRCPESSMQRCHAACLTLERNPLDGRRHGRTAAPVPHAALPHADWLWWMNPPASSGPIQD